MTRPVLSLLCLCFSIVEMKIRAVNTSLGYWDQITKYMYVTHIESHLMIFFLFIYSINFFSFSKKGVACSPTLASYSSFLFYTCELYCLSPRSDTQGKSVIAIALNFPVTILPNHRPFKNLFALSGLLSSILSFFSSSEAVLFWYSTHFIHLTFASLKSLVFP